MSFHDGVLFAFVEMSFHDGVLFAFVLLAFLFFVILITSIRRK